MATLPKNEGAEITEALLKIMDSMEIVNQVLIPALDRLRFQLITMLTAQYFSH